MSGDDPLHGRSAPTSYWSTANLAEAAPGVLTPLGWSVWGPAAEYGARAAFHSMGAIPAAERTVPARQEDRFINVFFGRAAARVDYLASIGDRMPGTSAEAIATQLLGSVPPGFVSRATRRRYPFVAVRLPRTFVAMPAVVRRARADTDAWWRAEHARLPGLDEADARAAFDAARRRFEANVVIQGTALIACIQGVYDQLSRLAAAAGVDSAPLMCGQGSHEETAVVNDLWALSRDRLDLATFLGRHGYHGPGEGELSGVVWREDPSPIIALLDGYRGLGDDADPGRAEAARGGERRRAEADLLARLPAARRGGARMVLGLARRYLPLRGVGKVAFLQSLDVARAAARRLGELLAREGILADAEDVFFLTAEELTGRLPDDVSAVVAERRSARARYQAVDIPGMFRGEPVPLVVGTPATAESAERDRLPTLTGTGASPGIVEGRAVVVHDPALVDVEPGDILVAHTTDPSWASIMFITKALVVDIGGTLSHAAVVARELDIPCVMGTQHGTRTLRTGDVCRVDGSAGTVEVLSRGGP